MAKKRIAAWESRNPMDGESILMRWCGARGSLYGYPRVDPEDIPRMPSTGGMDPSGTRLGVACLGGYRSRLEFPGLPFPALLTRPSGQQ